MTAARTFVIGDIHGCGTEFCDLLSRIGLQPTDTVISVGDAFDRGPDPKTVLEILLGSPRMEMVLGNHELNLAPIALRNGRELGAAWPGWRLGRRPCGRPPEEGGRGIHGGRTDRHPPRPRPPW
ncbi:MAG TPA: hypothetical protein DD417_06025 [Elusimicrobia bacterium]|nr:hypothetical protein [Elusimicrobiota bacterium]